MISWFGLVWWFVVCCWLLVWEFFICKEKKLKFFFFVVIFLLFFFCGRCGFENGVFGWCNKRRLWLFGLFCFCIRIGLVGGCGLRLDENSSSKKRCGCFEKGCRVIEYFFDIVVVCFFLNFYDMVKVGVRR